MRHNYTSAEEITGALKELGEVELIGHYGEGYHASLKYHLVKRVFTVYDHREEVQSTRSPFLAAEAYNSIRPR